MTGPPGAYPGRIKTKGEIEMKKFYVWGTGPVQSTLIREAEASLEAAEVAMEKGFSFGTTGDDWAVEVEATEDEIDEATRFDPAVAGYKEAK
jgi:hypothetical protein